MKILVTESIAKDAIQYLIDEGFELERIIEPVPDQDLLKKYPEHSNLFHKPDFLLVRASKRY